MTISEKLPYERLPTNVEDFRERRLFGGARTINDMVEEIALTLYRTEKFRKLLEAVYDEMAVEGSLSADNIMAAITIRDEARKIGRPEIFELKLATISKALGVVLRRYQSSRKQRRNQLGGKPVPEERNERDNGE